MKTTTKKAVEPKPVAKVPKAKRAPAPKIAKPHVPGPGEVGYVKPPEPPRVVTFEEHLVVARRAVGKLNHDELNAIGLVAHSHHWSDLVSHRAAHEAGRV